MVLTVGTKCMTLINGTLYFLDISFLTKARCLSTLVKKQKPSIRQTRKNSETRFKNKVRWESIYHN